MQAVRTAQERNASVVKAEQLLLEIWCAFRLAKKIEKFSERVQNLGTVARLIGSKGGKSMPMGSE